MRLTALCGTLVLAACAPRELNVTMNADNNSGQSGFAVLIDRGQEIDVVVETSAPEFEGVQRMHLHRGNCGEVDEIYADLLNLEPLADKPDRVGSTTRGLLKRGTSEKVQFDDFEEGDWLINVHDAREFTIYVSCGEFVTK
ncbi:MAG: hypothetical protein Q8N23_30615 [Archangium sp.]|nr:hypothetical protein [Archangium sp.]MDP3157064.1 hypothetical protein [Archangium sp.]MDP3575781.1 hypothetical protein [Archangium sp.]